ncbi:MAG: hypothetical protein ACXACF_02300 [Candidatus Hermodarchaeia archaeon]|jgi:hypothetical protein
MPLYRTDLYVKLSTSDFDLKKSSETLFQFLQKVSELRNVQITKARLDREEQGKIRIEEWYELTGSINVPEGGKSFWAISKESTEQEPFNFFMRIDRNTEAEDYEFAQTKASDWVLQKLIQPLETRFTFKEKIISSPVKLSRIANELRESR